MKHLLVTNDFPPKVGGIQSYLWELWRRLPPSEFAVLTTPFTGDSAFDDEQPFRIERTTDRMLLPRRHLVGRIDALAREIGADVVLLDPALPIGLVGPQLERPYGVVLHGSEVTVPGRLPVTRRMLARVLRGARVVVSAGGYPASEAERVAGRSLPTVIVPPGVDTERFRPLGPAEREAARRHFGFDPHAPLVVGVSRLVPRKGFDTVLMAVTRLRRSIPAFAWRSPARDETTTAYAGSPHDSGRPRGSSGAFRTRLCPSSTAVPTCSPWPVVTGGPDSSKRGSASCSWKRPPQGSLRSRADREALPKRWSTTRPATSSTAPTT